MKKSTIFSLAAVGLGIILIGLSIILVGGNFKAFGQRKNADSDYIYHKYECSSDINALDVKELSEAAIITTGDVNKPVVEYYERKDHDYVEVKEAGGKLSFERIEKHNGWDFEIIFGFDFANDTKTRITLPKDYEGPIDASCSSGSLKISDFKNSTVIAQTSSGSVSVENIEKSGKIYVKATSGSAHASNVNSDGNVTVETSSGSSKADNVKCADFYCHTTSGSVNVSNIESKNSDIGCSSGSLHGDTIKAEGSLKAGTTSGLIKLLNITCSDLSTESGSGSSRFDNATVDSVIARTTSGGLHFDNLTIGKSAEFKSTSGSISGNINGKESDFSIISSTGSGSSNLKNSREGAKTLDASATSGSIHINFNN